MITKEVWQEFEGRALDAGIVVRKCLAASDRSGLFEAEFGGPQPKNAAIKLISVDTASAARERVRVEEAMRLSHPGLLRILRCGLWPVEQPRVIYVMTEYAPENLAEVVSKRTLTPAETAEAVATTLDVLAYLHQQGYAHGHLTPSNILAVDDQVKISSDGLMRIGDVPAIASSDAYHPPEASRGAVTPAWDVWALGATIMQVLTQQPPSWERGEPRKLLVPATLPEPFREIARNCLQDDPQRRWTVERIQARLGSGGSSEAAPRLASAGADWSSRRFVMPAAGTGVALVALLVVLGLTHQRPAAPTPAPAPQTAPGSKTLPEKGRPSPFESDAALPKQGEAGGPEASAATGPGAPAPPATPGQPQAGNAPDAIVRRVMPKVSAKARNTIQGTVRVGVSVQVDAKGKVKRATLANPGPSRYFAKQALSAARGWKFTPVSPNDGDPVRSWLLRFAFRRSGTEVQSIPSQSAVR